MVELTVFFSCACSAAFGVSTSTLDAIDFVASTDLVTSTFFSETDDAGLLAAVGALLFEGVDVFALAVATDFVAAADLGVVVFDGTVFAADETVALAVFAVVAGFFGVAAFFPEAIGFFAFATPYTFRF
jgi:hypothetical protein